MNTVIVTEENIEITIEGMQPISIVTVAEQGPRGPAGLGVTLVPEFKTIDAMAISAKGFALQNAPKDGVVLVDSMDGGGPMVNEIDFIVTGNFLSWSSLRLEGVVEFGDQFRIAYLTT